MITTIKHNGITWINIDSPAAKDVTELAKEYPIHPLIAEELISPTLRSKVDIYHNSIYLILHFSMFNPATQISNNCEVDFVVGKNFLITTMYKRLEPLEYIVKSANTKPAVREKYFQKHAGNLLFYILKELYEFSLRELDHIQVKINRVEEQIFDGAEKEVVRKISILKRDILDFRRAVCPHDSILKSFEEHGKNLFGKDYEPYLNVLSGEHAKVKNLMESSKEIIDSLHETNESLLTTKTNEIIKILTIMAFITFPLMLFSSLFGMNTKATPILGMTGDFWIIIFAMLLTTFGMFLYFKKKKWL